MQWVCSLQSGATEDRSNGIHSASEELLQNPFLLPAFEWVPHLCHVLPRNFHPLLWCNSVHPQNRADTALKSTFTAVLDPKGKNNSHFLKVVFSPIQRWLLISDVWAEYVEKRSLKKTTTREEEGCENIQRQTSVVGCGAVCMQKQWHLVDGEGPMLPGTANREQAVIKANEIFVSSLGERSSQVCFSSFL